MTWWNTFSFLHVSVNQEAVLGNLKTKKSLYGFVMRAICKYVKFILINGNTKFHNALVNTIKNLDWTTYQCKIISNSRFTIIENMDLDKYNLATFYYSS